jgi:hypothetical protein
MISFKNTKTVFVIVFSTIMYWKWNCLSKWCYDKEPISTIYSLLFRSSWLHRKTDASTLFDASWPCAAFYWRPKWNATLIYEIYEFLVSNFFQCLNKNPLIALDSIRMLDFIGTWQVYLSVSYASFLIIRKEKSWRNFHLKPLLNIIWSLY